MDYSIRVYRINKENSNLRGFVSITFENSFCAKNIALKESAKGNLYLEMPSTRSLKQESIFLTFPSRIRTSGEQ